MNISRVLSTLATSFLMTLSAHAEEIKQSPQSLIQNQVFILVAEVISVTTVANGIEEVFLRFDDRSMLTVARDYRKSLFALDVGSKVMVRKKDDSVLIIAKL